MSNQSLCDPTGESSSDTSASGSFGSRHWKLLVSLAVLTAGVVLPLPNYFNSYCPAREAYLRQDADSKKHLSDLEATEEGVRFLSGVVSTFDSTLELAVKKNVLIEKAKSCKRYFLIGTILTALGMSSSLVLTWRLRRPQAALMGFVAGSFIGWGAGELLQAPPAQIGRCLASYEAANFTGVLITAVVFGVVGTVVALLCGRRSER